MAFQVDKPIPTDSLTAFAAWCARQFERVAAMWGDDVEAVTYRVLYVAPTRIRAGMTVYADGTKWNPGSGEGLYRRNKANAAWVFVG